MKRNGLLPLLCLTFALCASAQTPNNGMSIASKVEKPQVTMFLHQTLGESWDDFMRITGTKMNPCESHTPELAQWCEGFKKIEASGQGELTSRKGDASVSLVFSEKKLTKVMVQGKADYFKTLAELNQQLGAPDTKNTNSAVWSFADGGGITAVGTPGNQVTVAYYCKDVKEEVQQILAQSSHGGQTGRTNSVVSETVPQKKYDIQDTIVALGESREKFFSTGDVAEQLAACKAGNYASAFRDKGDNPEFLCKFMVKASTGEISSYSDGSRYGFSEYKFSNGQFVSFSKTFPGVLGGEKDFQIWSDVLVREYGAPTTTKTQTFQNAYGATLSGKVYVWSGKNTTLLIQDLPSFGDDARVVQTAVLNSYIKEQEPALAPTHPPATLP
jgi:hypothetical protein